LLYKVNLLHLIS